MIYDLKLFMRLQYKSNWCGMFIDAATRDKLREENDTSLTGAAHSSSEGIDKDACQWNCLTDVRCIAAVYTIDNKCFIYYDDVKEQPETGFITFRRDTVTSPGEFTWRPLLFSRWQDTHITHYHECVTV